MLYRLPETGPSLYWVIPFHPLGTCLNAIASRKSPQAFGLALPSMLPHPSMSYISLSLQVWLPLLRLCGPLGTVQDYIAQHCLCSTEHSPTQSW